MAGGINADSLDSAIMDALAEYSSATDRVVSDAVKDVAKEVKKEVQDAAPSRTGAYKKGFAVKIEQKNSHLTQATVYNRKKYYLTHLLQNGHARRNGGAKVAGKDHFSRAEADAEEKLMDKIKKGAGS